MVKGIQSHSNHSLQQLELKKKKQQKTSNIIYSSGQRIFKQILFRLITVTNSLLTYHRH